MTAAPLRLVIDTNVLLDCWVFDDPRARPLWQALIERPATLRCLRSDATDAELADVLARAPLAQRLQARRVDGAALLAQWRALAEPVPRLFAAPWGCSDPHDQKFLDLACTGRAQLLVSKDKALLKVGRRARASGLQIAAVADAMAMVAARIDAAPAAA